MNFLELVKNRYSCRNYQAVVPEQEKLAYIMECARLAPSAVNRQPWNIIEMEIRKVIVETDRLFLRQMNEDDFVFSLYPNDLVRIRFGKEMKFSRSQKDSTLPDERVMQEGLFYYRGTNISTGAIGIINHDNTYVIHGLGVKRLPLMEKYQVDVLGNISKIGKEKRMSFK